MDALTQTLREQLDFVAANPLLSLLTIGALVVGVGLIVWLAWKQTSHTNPLRERTVIVLMAVAFGLLMLNYFFPGDFVRGDGPLHISRAWLMMDILGNGELPIWSNRWYFGFPGEMFYGPITYLTIGGFSQVSGLDIFASSKIVLWVLHVLSGVFMYIYAVRLFVPKTAGVYTDAPLQTAEATRPRRWGAGIAIFAALAYVLSWQHFGVVRRFGVLPLAFIFALVPLYFILLETYLRKRIGWLGASALGGVLCALSVLTHIQYGVYLSGTYFVVLMWIGFLHVIYRDWKAVKNVLLLFLGTGIAAALLGAWFVVPSAMERDYFPSIPAIITEVSIKGVIDVILNIGLVTRLFSSWGQGYIGLTLLIPAFIGVILVSRRIDRRKGITRESLIRGYPLLIAAVGFFALDPIKRYTGVWLFFVCIAAAYGVKWIIEQVATTPTRALRLQTAALMFVVLEMGAALLLVGDYLSVDAVHTQVAALQSEVTASGVPGRIMTFKPDRGIFWRAQDAMDTGASVVFGSPMEAALNTHNFMAAITNELATEVYDNGDAPSETLNNLLRLTNVRYVLTDDDSYFEVENATPVIFAPTVQIVGAEDPNGVMGMDARAMYERRDIRTEYVDAVAAGMGLDSTKPEAQTILLDESTVLDNAPVPSCAADPNFSFANAVEQHNSVAFNYNSGCEGYVRLAYAYYPLLRLEVDGVETPFYKDALDMIAFRAPAGEHQVTLRAVISPLRQTLVTVAVISAGALLIGAIIWGIMGARKKTEINLPSSARQGSA